MLSAIANIPILGKPLILYLGVITFLLLVFTALIAVLNKKGVRKISFKWHYRLAIITIILAAIHGLLALLSYSNL